MVIGLDLPRTRSVHAPGARRFARWPVRPPDPTAWPVLWARCWGRIQSWGVPPGWSCRDWWDEARGQGALAACEALRDFDPRRLVPLEGFLYQRVVAGVWTRHRQEWSFGSRCRTGEPLPDRPAPARECNRPDPELVECLALVLRTLAEADRRLLRELYWGGRSEDEIARGLGVSRQAVNKRKQKLLRRLRTNLICQGVTRA